MSRTTRCFFAGLPGNVVATLDVSGLQNGQPGSSYTDHYEIDRVP